MPRDDAGGRNSKNRPHYRCPPNAKASQYRRKHMGRDERDNKRESPIYKSCLDAPTAAQHEACKTASADTQHAGEDEVD